MSFTPARPCGVSSPGATPQSGHGSVEYSLRRAACQVGERTPCRLTIIAYLSSAFGSRAAAGGTAASTAANIRTPCLGQFALIDKDPAPGVMTVGRQSYQ